MLVIEISKLLYTIVKILWEARHTAASVLIIAQINGYGVIIEFIIWGGVGAKHKQGLRHNRR